MALDKADERNIAIRSFIMPSLDLYESVCRQLDLLTKQVRTVANNNPICRRLMTAPGIGHIVALSYMTAVDQPLRFKTSEDIGAYFGLTPKLYQSGETDYEEGISRLGNKLTRQHLVQAATVVLASTKKWSALRAWGMKIAKKRGFNIARIAVARKLAIILHRMWINDQDFRWSAQAAEQGLADKNTA